MRFVYERTEPLCVDDDDDDVEETQCYAERVSHRREFRVSVAE